MIGYHYTTHEAWEQIQHQGMLPAPIRQHEYDIFLASVPTLPRDAIWVWKEELTDQEAFVVLTSLAVMHDSFDLVLLAVDYDSSSSALTVCKENPDDLLRLTCDFSIGHLTIDKQQIDLILDPVPANNIMELWSVNLLNTFRGRHKTLGLSVA